MVVVCEHKFMVSFDSLHNEPDLIFIDAVCTLIHQDNSNEDWSQWTEYALTDIPKQVLNGQVSGNCGVHICFWAMTVATGFSRCFSEEDMDQARKSISNIFYKVKNRKKNAYSRVNKSLKNLGNLQVKRNHDFVSTQNVPLGFKSTLEFCSSIPLLFPERKLTRSSTK